MGVTLIAGVTLIMGGGYFDNESNVCSAVYRTASFRVMRYLMSLTNSESINHINLAA